MAEVIMIKNEFAEAGAEKSMEECILQTAIQVHNVAVQLCPVDYGQLRNSLMYKVEETEGGFNSQGGELAPADQVLTKPNEKLQGVVGTNSDHWFPEFGTRNQVAQPFLRPAADRVRGATAQQIGEKWGRAAMEKEYAKRKTKKKVIK